MELRFVENGLHFWLQVNEDGVARLLTLGRERRNAPETMEGFRCAEVQITGESNVVHGGHKQVGLMPGWALKHVQTRDVRNEKGRKIEVEQRWQELTVVSHYQFFDGIPVVRAWTDVKNAGAPVDLEAVSSLVLMGLLDEDAPLDNRAQLSIGHNAWCNEVQWRTYTLTQLGHMPFSAPNTTKRISVGSVGTWGSSEYLPMGAFAQRDGKNAYVWQIETSGAWHWEMADVSGVQYLSLSGPNQQDCGWCKTLEAGETFTSIPCAIAFAPEGFEAGIQALTRYRRAIRRENQDNENPSVIFNDYMNCLMADPTTEKEKPLIEAASRIGCKYYVVDAGWYSDGYWWDNVGEWLPAKKRFPGGLMEVLDDIRAHGMIPGLWLELEVMGVKCSLADKVPDEWFFMRNGKRVATRSRYQLDYSNPEVRAYADSVVDRLVKEYGVGYIKMDYNIDAGMGTQTGGVSVGEGLRRHEQAYLDWLDGVYARYPELVIENCSSGGMRMEYSQLSRHSIESVTDQTDYLKMGRIACNAMTAVTPGQAAIWSYPLRDGDEEEVCFNMVNAMLLRVHQSGHLAEMSPSRLALVQEGLELHREIVQETKDGVPVWPLGLADIEDDTFCMGVECGDHTYLAVWNAGKEGHEVSVPCSEYADAQLLYPSKLPRTWAFGQGVLNVTLAGKTACVFKLTK